jgi:hypothetical protein
MNPNAVNQLVKGTEIYTEGDPVFSVALILKGRVLISNCGAKINMGSGAFLGVNDLFAGRYFSTYTACDDVLLYVFAINKAEELEQILSVNKDYHGFMVAAYYKMIYELDMIVQGAEKLMDGAYQFLKDNYATYTASTGIRENKAVAKRLAGFCVPENDLELFADKIRYYAECRKLPVEVVKTFYSYGNEITLYQVEDQANMINRQMEALKKLSAGLVYLAEGMVDGSDTCLFELVAANTLEMDSADNNGEDAMNVLDDIIDEVNKIEIFIDRYMGQSWKADREKMEQIYHKLLTAPRDKKYHTKTQTMYSEKDSAQALEQLSDSFKTILEYSGINTDRAEEMQKSMRDYINLRDKTDMEDSSRSLRRKLTEDYYELYRNVFLENYRHKSASRIIDLFLNYGYADERLLTEEQLISIYYLEQGTKEGHCNVYSIGEWLTLIYEGKKEPSKNEFDLEYSEMVAGLRKQAKLTDAEVKEWLTSPERKLEYEIQNMFRYNNRLANGQITTFVPYLHKEALSDRLDKILLTPKKVNEAVNELLKIDYSIFYRELLYVNNEKNITKEYIIKNIYPDIILLPIMGNNAIMWQEIAGKRRDSAGRFLLPVFTEINLKSLLVRLFGRFRWELCRSLEGSAWNDIKHKSLTSEYSDYLQFYRRNKELSEEKKEKIKFQIQKGRNSSREIFVLDYEQWIVYEAMGAIKLNKPVRELMATYCPFSREIRDNMRLQPLFEEAMSRYYREKLKKVREIENRHRNLQKEQIELTVELMDTLTFYRDL